MNDHFEPGDRVKLRARALYSMCALAGPLAFQVWTVQACDCDLCALGRHVALDDRHVAAAKLRHADRVCVDELRAEDSDALSVGIGRGIWLAARGRAGA